MYPTGKQFDIRSEQFQFSYNSVIEHPSYWISLMVWKDFYDIRDIDDEIWYQFIPI